jgi:hypothetical protein
VFEQKRQGCVKVVMDPWESGSTGVADPVQETDKRTNSGGGVFLFPCGPHRSKNVGVPSLRFRR